MSVKDFRRDFGEVVTRERLGLMTRREAVRLVIELAERELAKLQAEPRIDATNLRQTAMFNRIRDRLVATLESK